jgi:hypothetical protein
VARGTAVGGRLVNGELLTEFLVGELREKIDPVTILDHDDLDKDVKPAAGKKWKICRNEDGGFDLTKIVGQLNDALVHACVYVYAESSCKVQMLAGSDDGIEILVNGKVVHKNTIKRVYTLDADQVKDVPLAKGWNTILLGIAQYDGGWGFSLRILDEDGKAPRGLHCATELPRERLTQLAPGGP